MTTRKTRPVAKAVAAWAVCDTPGEVFDYKGEFVIAETKGEAESRRHKAWNIVQPVLILPLPAARKLARFVNLTPEERVLEVAKEIWRKRRRYALPPLPLKQLQTIYLRQARAVLALLGL